MKTDNPKMSSKQWINHTFDDVDISFTQHDRIYQAALDLKWNEMSLKQQYLYMLFIQRCQSPNSFTIAGVLPVNLETFVKVKIDNNNYYFVDLCISSYVVDLFENLSCFYVNLHNVSALNGYEQS